MSLLPLSFRQLASLDGLPVLYSKEISFGLLRSEKRWVQIEQVLAGEALVLSEAEFFGRFGSDIPAFPEGFRGLDHRLSLIVGTERRFAKTIRRVKGPRFKPGTFMFESAEIIDLATPTKDLP